VVLTTYRVTYIGNVAFPVTALMRLELRKECNVFVGQLSKVSHGFKTQAVELTFLHPSWPQWASSLVAPANR